MPAPRCPSCWLITAPRRGSPKPKYRTQSSRAEAELVALCGEFCKFVPPPPPPHSPRPLSPPFYEALKLVDTAAHLMQNPSNGDSGALGRASTSGISVPASTSPETTRHSASGEVAVHVLGCRLTCYGQVVTNAEARFSFALRPRKP